MVQTHAFTREKLFNKLILLDIKMVGIYSDDVELRAEVVMPW